MTLFMHNEFIGELLGTLFLIVFGGGVVANVLLARSKGQNGGWISIAIGWGVAVLFGVFIAQATGSIQADINPAVTFAKYIMGGTYTWQQALLYSFAEIVGAFLGAVIVWLVYLPHWVQESDVHKKLMIYCTVPAIRHLPSNFLTEMIATFILVLGIGALVTYSAAMHTHAEFIPYMVGMLVLGIGLSLGGPTGYAINPARDFGPRLAHAILPIAGKGSSDWSYAWVPIAGPLVGALLGAIVWRLLF